jgi:hypothetical protein
MEFRPFWDLIEQLGIVLPNASKIRGNQPDRATSTSRSRRLTSIPSPSLPGSAAELLELLNTIAEEAAEEDVPADRNDRLETRSDRFWLPLGKTAQVAGYEIPGMVYVGSGLSSVNNIRASETSLILSSR